MGMILPVFHKLGIALWFIEWLKIVVRALIALVPSCFRWRYDMLSGPVEREFLETLMDLAVISGSEELGVFVQGDIV